MNGRTAVTHSGMRVDKTNGLISAAARTSRTVRHLRPGQIVALIRRRLLRPSRRLPASDYSVWEPFDETGMRAVAGLGPVDEAGAIAARVRAFAEGRIEMMACSQAWTDALHQRADVSPLWRYHFHYHDLLAEAAWAAGQAGRPALAAQVADALAGWLDVWGSGGGPAWDPYPVSVRLVNWIRIIGCLEGNMPRNLHSRMLHLHTSHLELLSRKLERDLLANHLLRNASALVIGSHCWSGAQARRLRRSSCELLFEQVLSQVGTDGVHEERSTMYHLRVLVDVLEALAVLRAHGTAVRDEVQQRVRSMAEALRWFIRSDGRLFLLNDAAPDHGVSIQRVLDIAERLLGSSPSAVAGVRVFPDASLVVAVEPTLGSRLLVDLGGPAPEHQPAHSHAGALGVDLDLLHHPLLVDTGCSGYDGDPFRPFFRGTRSHNTVVIDGRDQSEMWGTFRVARRAQVSMDTVDGSFDDLVVKGTCIPYHDRSARHHRTIRLAGSRVHINDQVCGGLGKRIELHWHLHPDWSIESQGNELALFHTSGQRGIMRIEGADATSLHRGDEHAMIGWYAAGFGHVIPIWTVRATIYANDGRDVATTVHVGC